MNLGGISRHAFVRMCECGWPEADCEREQNIDGDGRGHEQRFEDASHEEQPLPRSERRRAGFAEKVRA